MPRERWWKRGLDLAIGVPLAVVAVPVIALLAAAVRLDSAGPIFFVQERVGRLGCHFRLWKLRSMHHGAGDDSHRVAAAAWFEGAAGASEYPFKSLDDPRITRVGRFLRRTNLDEIPQLLNVLRGEMSLVGPRPAIPYELGYYQARHFERQTTRPGITGLWQLSDRERISAQGMMALDAEYIRIASPGLDLRILWRTAIRLLRDLCGGG